jgi:hypothetical protein
MRFSRQRGQQSRPSRIRAARRRRGEQPDDGLLVAHRVAPDHDPPFEAFGLHRTNNADQAARIPRADGAAAEHRVAVIQVRSQRGLDHERRRRCRHA